MHEIYLMFIKPIFFYLFTYNEPPVISIMYTYEKIEMSKDMTRKRINHKI